MRLAHVRNHFAHLHRDSAVLTAVVLFGLTTIVGLGFWVSYASFRFTETFIFGPDLNAKLIALLFFSLLVLVGLSTILISYVSLFVARETGQLFQSPIPPRTILFAKSAEAISFSTWASLFLCFPVLVAYGVRAAAPFAYYPTTVVVLVLFLSFAGLVGTSITLLLAPILRRMTTRRLVIATMVTLAVLAWLFLRSFDFWALDGENNLLVLDRFMSGLQAMQSPWSPSRWASAAILAASAGHSSEVLFHSLLLAANTLIFLPILSIYGRRRYGREWIEHQGATAGRDRTRERAGIERRSIARDPVRALIRKDLSVFLRSPAQLSQSILFVLLMIIYSLSLLRFPEYFRGATLKIFVHFANLGAVCLILSAFTSRFLFPQLSLEGRAFWIIGLAPMPRSHLLRQKLIFGLAISATLGLLTITVSNLALRTPFPLFAGAVWSILLAAYCLTSLATGLGAAYPSFQEDNPARIAAGLGGTLNFFASALAVAAIVVIEGLPYLTLGTEPPAWSLLAAHVAALLFTAVVGSVVLRLGRRALARCEF